MNRGLDHRQIFDDDQDRLHFEYRLGRMRVEHEVEIHAYCLMGNHFHLLLHCPKGGLSEGLHLLESAYVRRFNERIGRDGPLFRSRFHSVPVATERQLVATALYVHRNPIDLVPAGALVAYRWSSLGAYLGRRSVPDWLEVGVVSSLIDSTRHLSLVVSGVDVEAEEVDAFVRSAFGRDPGAQKAARLILLAEHGRCTPLDLAERLGLGSTGAVRTALARARRRQDEDAEFGLTVASIRARLRAA